ncbi:MAG: hypothetical protein ACK4GN_11620 [Runella sp.]
MKSLFQTRCPATTHGTTTKHYFYATLFVAMALLAGCSKPAPEPEPAEQVIGTYNVDRITESFRLAGSPTESSETLNLPFKDGQGNELSMTLGVSKKSANIISIAWVQLVKYANGRTDRESEAFDNIELKKMDNSPGQFEMFDAGTKVGTIGNNRITYEEVITGRDSLNRAFTYTFRMTGQKAN